MSRETKLLPTKIESALNKAVHEYMEKAVDLVKLRRKAGEILLGTRGKTHSLNAGCEFKLFSTLETAYSTPILLGLLELTQDYRYIKPGELIIFNVSKEEKRLYGLLDKELIGSGINEDAGGATFVAVLSSIGGIPNG